MTNRRHFIGGASLGLLATALSAVAQQARKNPRIALVSNGVPLAEMAGPNPTNINTRALVYGLRDLGWIDGQNIVIERLSAAGNPERLPALIREVVELKVDVVVVYGTRMAFVAKKETATIPIVVVAAANPVAQGLVTQLARPGGNITGLSMDAGSGLAGKRFELLAQIVPGATRIAFLRSRPLQGRPPWDPETESAAKALRLTLSLVAIGVPEDFNAAFAAMARNRPDAIFCTEAPILQAHMNRIIDFAARERLPAIYPLRLFAESGGLMAYGPDLKDISRRAAGYIDKILKGAKAGDLPIEQPTKFELVINKKTANALGLKIPQSVLALADEVIQ